MLGNAERMFMFKNNDRAHESLLDKNSASKILRLAPHGQPYSSFPHPSPPQTPSLPDADPRAGHPRCGGLKSNFLADSHAPEKGLHAA